MMHYYDMMGTGMGWQMGLFGIIYFIFAVFIFSAIFWLTYNWIVKDSHNEKRKRKK